MVAPLAAMLSAPTLSLAACVLGITFAVVTPMAIEAASPGGPTPGTIATSHTGLVNAPDGIAIKGYDPVAYFTEGQPVLGDPQIQAELDGATWQFTTPEHRSAFLAHPTRYEPEYGGFCAYGASKGLKTDIDPAAFSIIGGRLYLNANIDVRAKWRNNLLSAIAKADRNWAGVKDQPLLR